MKRKSRKIHILLSAIKLDIINLNYEYSSEKVGCIDKLARGLKERHVAAHVLLFFFYLVRSGIKRCFVKRKREPVKDILIFCQGEKHVWSLNPVAECLPYSTLIDNGQGMSGHFSRFAMRLYSLPYIIPLLTTYMNSEGYVKRSFRYIFDSYWVTYGNYVVYRRFFQKYPIKILVVANDHSYPCTTIVKAAQDEGVVTVYIQHASVNDRFPPLTVDYALLEGLDALEKYNLCGKSQTRVFLIGMPKLDAFIPMINRNRSLTCLGICSNNLDEFSNVEELLKRLRSRFFDLSIVFRPHPGDICQEWVAMCRKYSLKYSDPMIESSFDFLSTVDVIIVGDSSIALEAALLNVYPIYFDYNNTNMDYYGFIKNNLIEKHTSTYDDVVAWVYECKKRKPDIRLKTKRYCYTVGTILDGRSSELAAKLISDICIKGDFDHNQWCEIKGLNSLVAYEFNL